MPFDGRNFAKTEPEVFSLEGLIAWLERQPAYKKYCWMGHCLYEQFGEAHLPLYRAHAYNEAIRRIRRNDPLALQSGEPYHGVASNSPYTFGAALKRARAILAKRRS